VLGYLIPSESLYGLDNTCVQHPPPLLEQAAVGHLVRQGVLESVDPLGHQGYLVEQLGGLEVCQAPLERVLGHVRHGPQQRDGDLLANHGSRLEERLRRGRRVVPAWVRV
jgi:hypothetical protein